jgi:hypothetical protein
MRPNRSEWPANGTLRSAGGPCQLNNLFARHTLTTPDATSLATVTVER